jgi:hypothetical protein
MYGVKIQGNSKTASESSSQIIERIIKVRMKRKGGTLGVHTQKDRCRTFRKRNCVKQRDILTDRHREQEQTDIENRNRQT